MAVSNPYQNIFSETLASTNERTTATFMPHPAANLLGLVVLSVVAGTLDVDVQLSSGAWAEASTTAIVANTLTRISIVAGVKAIRGRFTPGAATSSLVTIDAAYAGHCQPS